MVIGLGLRKRQILKKILISAVEKKLDKELKRNTTVLGVDSASTTGMALLISKEKVLEFDTSIVKFGTHKKGTPINPKLETGIKSIEEYVANNIKKKTDITVIENAYLGTNKYVYGLLRMMAGVFYTLVVSHAKHLDFYYASEARRIVGFDSKKLSGSKLKKLVVDWVEYLGFGKLKHDEADAVILALAGLIVVPMEQKKVL